MDKPSMAGDLQPQVHSADRTATIYGPTLNEYACFVFRNFLFRTKQNTSVYIPANVTPVAGVEELHSHVENMHPNITPVFSSPLDTVTAINTASIRMIRVNKIA